MFRLLARLALLVAALVVSPTALTDDRPGSPGREASSASGVTAKVMVIHATTNSQYVDPALSHLERHLKHLRYSSYEVLNEKKLDLQQGKNKQLPVEGGRKVILTLISLEKDKARLRVKVDNARGNLAEITVAVPRNKPFIVSGPPHEGGILLIPITAQF